MPRFIIASIVFLGRVLLALGCFSVITTSGYGWWWSEIVAGSGPAQTETRSLDSFEQVNVAGSISVTLQIADGPPTATVLAQDNLLPLIKTKVEGKELSIYATESYRSDTPIRVTVKVSSISSVSLAGSGSVVGQGVIKSDRIEVSLGGSGDIALQLEAKKLEVSITGSGDVSCRGTAATLDLSIAGSGDFNGTRLSCTTAEVSVVGSGDATIDVSKLLNVSIMGSGDVTYYGKAQVTQSVLGSGSIRPAEPSL